MKGNHCLDRSPSRALLLSLFPTLKLVIQLLSFIHLTNHFGAQALCRDQTLGVGQRARPRPCCQHLKNAEKSPEVNRKLQLSDVRASAELSLMLLEHTRRASLFVGFPQGFVNCQRNGVLFCWAFQRPRKPKASSYNE